MTLDLAKIEQLVDLVSRSRIAELELTQDGTRVRIVKSPASRAAIPVSPAPELRPEEIRVATQETVHSADVSSTDEIIVPAPMHGVFYRAAAPDEPPLVGIGANIEAGQKLCIIEAMKTSVPSLQSSRRTVTRSKRDKPCSGSVRRVRPDVRQGPDRQPW
jgi:acetyl-CoA carboxylase biotin carboxyl carrier protein